MLKSALTIVFAVATLAIIPARAMDAMTCSDADMMKMQTSVMGMSDAAKKDMAMKEMTMAKDSMAKKDDKGCMMHVQKIQGMM
jgi:hypothetical protein